MLYTNHQQNILQIVEAIMNMLEYVINKRAKAMIEHKNQSLKCRAFSLYKTIGNGSFALI